MSFITDELFALGNAVKDNGGKADKVLIDSYSKEPQLIRVVLRRYNDNAKIPCSPYIKHACFFLGAHLFLSGISQVDLPLPSLLVYRNEDGCQLRCSASCSP